LYKFVISRLGGPFLSQFPADAQLPWHRSVFCFQSLLGLGVSVTEAFWSEGTWDPRMLLVQGTSEFSPKSDDA